LNDEPPGLVTSPSPIPFLTFVTIVLNEILDNLLGPNLAPLLLTLLNKEGSIVLSNVESYTSTLPKSEIRSKSASALFLKSYSATVSSLVSSNPLSLKSVSVSELFLSIKLSKLSYS